MVPKENGEPTYQDLFGEVKKQIALIYLSGTVAYIREHDQAIYDEILVTEIRLDDLWLSMREGKNTLEQFKETLTTWKELHLKAVGIYQKQSDRKEGEQGNLF